MNLKRDYLASRIISFGKEIDGYDRICYKINEDFESSLKNLVVCNKAVFTVLASSDQIFSFNYLGAKTDSFDINPLTLYYYYYRRWSILYGDSLYPDELLRRENFTIGLILDKVKPKTEEEKNALLFWRRHTNNKTDFNNLFFYTDSVGRSAFDEREDLLSAVKKAPNFHHIDLFKPVLLDKKYDFIYISNIAEWARSDPKKLRTLRDNLAALSNNDGMVICTNIIHRNDENIRTERDIFGDIFDIIDEGRCSYRYVKKR